MMLLNKFESDKVLVGLMDAYKHYVYMAKSKKSNSTEAKLWMDKANEIEDFALKLQAKPRNKVITKG